MLVQILSAVQLLSAILLIISILLQNRGTGLGAAFGGEGNVYRTKRGLESVMSKSTVVLVIIFLGVSLARVLIK